MRPRIISPLGPGARETFHYTPDRFVSAGTGWQVTVNAPIETDPVDGAPGTVRNFDGTTAEACGWELDAANLSMVVFSFMGRMASAPGADKGVVLTFHAQEIADGAATAAFATALDLTTLSPPNATTWFLHEVAVSVGTLALTVGTGYRYRCQLGRDPVDAADDTTVDYGLWEMKVEIY